MAFKPLIDMWGACPDKKIMYGAILSFDAVCMGSPVIIMLHNHVTKSNKQVEGKIRNFRDHHILHPYFSLKPMTELEIKCPLVYL